jgi:hypothetical protein
MPPAPVGGRCYVADAAGGVLVLGEDGRRIWSARLGENDVPFLASGPPAARGEAVWFLARDGRLVARSARDGSPLSSTALGVPPAGGPIALGEDLVIPTAPGTLRLLAGPAGAPAAATPSRAGP